MKSLDGNNIHSIRDTVTETLRKSVSTTILNNVSLIIYVTVGSSVVSELFYRIDTVIRKYERYIN